MKKRLYLIGAGDLGREMESWLLLIPDFNDNWEIMGYLDQNPNALNEYPTKFRIIGDPINYNYADDDYVLICVTNILLKGKLIEEIQGRVKFFSYIAPNAIIGNYVNLGVGIIICPNTLISSNVDLGDHVFINVGTQIGHDCSIGKNCSLMAHVNLGGHVTLSKNIFIGTSATIIPCISVNESITIGSGAVVIRNLKKIGTYFGNPAKLIESPTKTCRSELYIIGASGFGREIESWISQSCNFRNQYIIKGFLDDNLTALDDYESDFKVLSKIDDIVFNEGDMALLAIADPVIKENIVSRLKDRVRFVSFISDRAIVGKNVSLGEGTIIGPNCILTCNIKLGNFVSIIMGTIVGHNCTIGDYSSLMVHVGLGGKVCIGKKTFIGSNTTIMQGITVGERSQIDAGSIVKADLPDDTFAYGNPAKNYSKVIK
jgi:sugar O-acyltransferase (sialic acid O-acetyltransferase NeuD family)